MAFDVISTFYFPIAGSAGSSMWGTDVRKLLSSADASQDQTTVLNHGTGGAVTRTADPYTNSNTDADQTLFGWAIDPTDMGSTTDFVRSMAAGDHVLTARLANTGISATTVSCTLFAYRVGPAPTRTRTLLGSVTTTSPSLPALTVPTTVTITLSLGAITFASDETIQYSFETNVAGIAITGRNIQFSTGTQGGVAVRMDTPPLKILAATSGSGADGVGSATGVLSAQASMTGSSSGSSTTLGVPTAITSSTGVSDDTSSVTGVLGATAGLVGSSSGVATTSGTLGATAGLVGSSTSLASTAGVLAAIASLVGSAAGTSDAAGVPASLSGTVGTSQGTSTALAALSVVLGTVGTVDIGAGGGETVFHPIFLFDD